MAWADRVTVARWLDGQSTGSAQPGDIRERGYVVEIQTELSAQVADVLHRLRLSDPDTGTEMRDAALNEFIEELSERPDSLLGPLDNDGVYRVTTVGAPIFDSRGEVTTFVVVFGFRRPMSGRDIDRLGRNIRHRTAVITEQVGGRWPQGEDGCVDERYGRIMQHENP